MDAAGWLVRPGEKHDLGPDLPWREAEKGSRIINVWPSGRFSYRGCDQLFDSGLHREESQVLAPIKYPSVSVDRREHGHVFRYSSISRGALPRIGSNCCRTPSAVL